MSSNLLRREVLSSFKKLHRTRQSVFRNDGKISESVRNEINNNFKKNKNVVDINSIKELIKFAQDFNYELKTTVAEFEQTAPGRFRLHLRPEMFEEYEKILEK